ncbi:MAG: putative Zn-dependent peptidase [Myxococcota bacterium]
MAPGGLAILLAERLLEARLNATLRSELGATYGVHANVHRPSHGRTLEVTTSVGMPRAGDAVTSLLAAVEDIGAGNVTTAELDPLKLSFARETVTLWQSVPELAAWLRGLAEQGLPPDTDANLAARLHALTPADLAEALAPCTGREVVTVVGEAKAVAAALEGTGVRVQTR